MRGAISVRCYPQGSGLPTTCGYDPGGACAWGQWIPIPVPSGPSAAQQAALAAGVMPIRNTTQPSIDSFVPASGTSRGSPRDGNRTFRPSRERFPRGTVTGGSLPWNPLRDARAPHNALVGLMPRFHASVGAAVGVAVRSGGGVRCLRRCRVPPAARRRAIHQRTRHTVRVASRG